LLRASPGAYALRCAPPNRACLHPLGATGLLDVFAALHPHLLLGWECSEASVALLSALPGETPLSVLRYVMHTPGYTKARSRAEWCDAVGRYGGTMDVDE
jgi:hypothetical protein